MLSAGAFPSQPHWCRRPSPHEYPPPGFLGNATFTLMSTLAHRKPLSIRQPVPPDRPTNPRSGSVFPSFFFLFFFLLFSSFVLTFRWDDHARYRDARRASPGGSSPSDFESTNSLNTRVGSAHRSQRVALMISRWSIRWKVFDSSQKKCCDYNPLLKSFRVISTLEMQYMIIMYTYW